ncbi:MAG: putative methyltransferase [Acidimicrobiales bacterium]|nr:putative methyltransferase [Acidimicrobiales bacterium]
MADNGIDITCDIRVGLAVRDRTFDYAVSVHALQEIELTHLVPTLEELRRVLRPNGILRLVLPDADLAIDAYRARRTEHFLVTDECATSLGGKFVFHILWFGHSLTMFTRDFAEELLNRAGFQDIRHCAYLQTYSRFAEIVELDQREQESLFIEARR